ncbi:hypothetical protein QFC20_005714 [Naganishia adeliensis]|uniref:Uncharacterized protein n=1 Tax=Naganishia adeliensis TaxID=92952 RepID=A0ACC2VKN0_9TREE|nr:hypothetical protein QFC20_005714 [Naganishia adeliensis]
MSRHAHSTTDASAPLPVFSQVIESNGFLFASGQIGSTSDGKLVQGSIEDRTTQALKNLDAVFKSAGSESRTRRQTHRLRSFLHPIASYST